MPRYSFLEVVNWCLHMVRISVLIYWWIGDDPMLEAVLAFELFKLFVDDYVLG